MVIFPMGEQANAAVCQTAIATSVGWIGSQYKGTNMFHVYALNAEYEMIVECLFEDYKPAVKIAESLDLIYGRKNVCLELVIDDTEKV